MLRRIQLFLYLAQCRVSTLPDHYYTITHSKNLTKMRVTTERVNLWVGFPDQKAVCRLGKQQRKQGSFNPCVHHRPQVRSRFQGSVWVLCSRKKMLSRARWMIFVSFSLFRITAVKLLHQTKNGHTCCASLPDTIIWPLALGTVHP